MIEIRTEPARTALDSYLAKQVSGEERQFQIIDLISDLLHLAQAEGLDPEKIAAKAEFHDRTERLQGQLTA